MHLNITLNFTITVKFYKIKVIVDINSFSMLGSTVNIQFNQTVNNT